VAEADQVLKKLQRGSTGRLKGKEYCRMKTRLTKDVWEKISQLFVAA